MENKKTTELMSRKSTLKSKLMAAVSMLLVSAIMVSVTTYAWFILSTAPEVKGMSTTVGSNGALEMALLTTDSATNMDEKIKSGVGDSIATSGDVTAANITWGNLVDLGDTSYGLDQITLYPAQLSGITGLSRTASALSYAVYGTDGRVANLDGMTESGVRNKNGSFVADTTSYGVRAIGRAVAADEIKKNFNDAKTEYETHSKNAVRYANGAFGDNLETLLSAAQTVYINRLQKTDYFSETKNILVALNDLKSAVEEMQLAVKSAIAADKNSKATNVTQSIAKAAIKDIALNDYQNDPVYGTIVKDLNTLYSSISEKITTAENYTKEDITNPDEPKHTPVSLDQFKPLLEALLGVEGDGQNEGTKMVFELKDESGKLIEKEDRTPWTITDYAELAAVSSRVKSLEAKIRYGLFKDMAHITGSISANINYNNIPGVGTVTAAEPVDKVAIDDAVAKLNMPQGTGGAEEAFIENYYGYAIDLAFRTNASNNKLMLSTKAQSRVSGNEVMGAGSTFTFDKDVAVDDAVVNALRVAFVDANGNVKGVAKLDKTAVADNAKQYALKMYAVTKLENGVLTFGAQTDEIMALPQSKAAMLTAIVYMDGTDLDNTVATGVTGKLNLQFCGSVNLTAMDYSGYNKGISLDGAVSTLEVGKTSGPITAKFNGADLTSPAQFSWKSSSEKVTVTATDGTKNTATITAASGATVGEEVTITVSYGNYSKTFTVRVIAAATP